MKRTQASLSVPRRKNLAAWKKEQSNHEARAGEALAELTQKDVHLFQTRPEEQRAWKDLCEALMPHTKKDRSLLRAMNVYGLWRTALHGAFETALSKAQTYAVRLGPEVAERRAGKKKASAKAIATNQKRMKAVGIHPFEKYRDEFFRLLKSMKARQAADTLRRKHGLKKCVLDTMPRYFRRHPTPTQ